MKKYLITVLIAGVTTLPLWAGVDHDHGAPTFQAPKGGILQSTHASHFELVAEGGTVKIYPYDQKGKGRATKEFKASAELELPRKKGVPLKLVDEQTHWSAKISVEGVHRYTIKLKIEEGGDRDYVKFTVETK